jgi:hypothetical protein
MIRALTVDGGCDAVVATSSSRGVITASRRLVSGALLARVVFRSLATDS